MTKIIKTQIPNLCQILTFQIIYTSTITILFTPRYTHTKYSTWTQKEKCFKSVGTDTELEKVLSYQTFWQQGKQNLNVYFQYQRL